MRGSYPPAPAHGAGVIVASPPPPGFDTGMGMLRNWFGPSRGEIWRQLAKELPGRYTAGRWFKQDRIDVEHGAWTITLDTYVVMANNTPIPFTRFRAPYKNAEQFRFNIYRASVFSTIGKWFGMQDIEVGALAFDEDFVVKASDERLVRRFCRNAELRRMLRAQKSVQLSIVEGGGWFGPKLPADTDLLSAVVSGHLKDTARIEELFALFATALDQLCEIGAAYADAPDFTL